MAVGKRDGSRDGVTIEKRELRKSWKNCLSPVIQAILEARTVGWLEKEGSLRPGRIISVAALWPTCLGRPTQEVKLMYRVEGCKDRRTRVRAPARDPPT